MDIRIVDGRLTKDAEVKTIKTTGTKFLTFTLANNSFAKGEQTTTFFNVVSYNNFDIERAETFTKGKLLVISGKPSENITVKDNKTYLNRNIIAHNIEYGTFSNKESNEQSSVTTYHDVAPIQPNTPQSVAIPQPQLQPSIPTCEVPQPPTFQVENNSNYDDDLPF